MHETQAWPYTDWNQELLESVVKALTATWFHSRQSITQCKETFFAGLYKLLEGIRVDLQGE